jgi:hypothetical protein
MLGRALGGDQVVKRQLGMQEGEVFLTRVEQHEIVGRHVHQLERRDHAVEGEHRCAGVLQARDHRQQRLHGRAAADDHRHAAVRRRQTKPRQPPLGGRRDVGKDDPIVRVADDRDHLVHV